MVAVTGALVELIALNEAMLPVPVAANPIVGLLFVQLYEGILFIPPVNVIKLVEAPLHNAWFGG